MQNTFSLSAGQKGWQTIWFWWILLTAFYILLGFVSPFGSTLTYFVGLFVPIGFVGLFGVLISIFSNPIFILTIPALLVAFYFVNQFSGRSIKKPWHKILVYLAALLVLTFLTDTILYGCYQSYRALSTGDSATVCGAKIE